MKCLIYNIYKASVRPVSVQQIVREALRTQHGCTRKHVRLTMRIDLRELHAPRHFHIRSRTAKQRLSELSLRTLPLESGANSEVFSKFLPQQPEVAK
jgi:hypothetical protein